MRRDAALAAAAGAVLVAASLSLSRVLMDGTWRAAAWVPAALALLTAFAARRLHAGPVTATAASAAAWALYVHTFHLETGGFLPGPDQVREFVAVWRDGMVALPREPAPARPLPGLLLLVSTGVWWLAHATHELLVRCGRPGPALMTAAALWVAPLAVPQAARPTAPHAIPFLAAAALVFLVDPDPDLRSRRRRATPPLGTSVAGAGLAAVAIAVAVAAPGILPGYGAAAWVDVSGSDAARGYQPIVDVSRRLRLPAPRDLLRVRADRPLYLRLAGLDTFDGGTWRLGPPGEASYAPRDVLPVDGPLPPETPLGPVEPATVEVDNLSLENVFVPVPYHPVSIGGEAARRMVYSREGGFVATSEILDDEPALLPGLSYYVDAALPAPTPEELRTVAPDVHADPAYAQWLELPRAYPELRGIADEVVAAAATPYDAALAIQDFFRDRSRFSYSTDVPPLRDPDALLRFVTEDRRGYCEYFATAMAVMLRLEGIPARVAVGFRVGEEVPRPEGSAQNALPGAADDPLREHTDTEPSTRDYLVTTEDAHAWVEVLFPGYGWISFEPTPALPDALVPTREEVAPRVPVGQVERGPSNPADTPDIPRGDAPTQAPARRPPPRADAPWASQPPAEAPWTVPLAAAGIAAVVAAAVAVWAATRRHPPRGSGPAAEVLAAQRRLFAAATAYGAGRRPAETAAEVARRWAAEGRVDAAAALRLADLAQAAAFGGDLDRRDADEAARLQRHLAAALRASVGRRGRALAPLRRAATAARATLPHRLPLPRRR